MFVEHAVSTKYRISVYLQKKQKKPQPKTVKFISLDIKYLVFCIVVNWIQYRSNNLQIIAFYFYLRSRSAPGFLELELWIKANLQ